MKREFEIVGASMLLVFGIVFLIFVFQSASLTGYVVAGDEEVSGEDEGSFTREDALQELDGSQEIIDEMKAANFSGTLTKDLLIEAEKVFQQVEYAEILRGNINATASEKSDARSALSLVDWRFINYSDILEYTDDIVEVRELAFYVGDLLSIQEGFLGAVRDESGEIVSFSKVEELHLERFKFLVNGVEHAIREERYSEALELAEELKEEVDIRRTEVFTALVLAQGAGSFILKYWYLVLLILGGLVFGGIYFSKRLRQWLLKRKIQTMKTEEMVLMGLMKKTQVERFKEGKVSGLVYNIRIKKYNERLGVIKEDLPVLEKRLAGGKVKKAKKK